MKKVNKPVDQEISFERSKRRVVIRTTHDRVTLEIDGTIHEVRFLENGRPYTSAFVNTMVMSVRDLAEQFVDTMARQQAHWDKLAGHCTDGGDR